MKNNINPNYEEDFNLLSAQLELLEQAGIGMEDCEGITYVFYVARNAKHILFRIMGGIGLLGEGEASEYLNSQRGIEEANANIRKAQESEAVA